MKAQKGLGKGSELATALRKAIALTVIVKDLVVVIDTERVHRVVVVAVLSCPSRLGRRDDWSGTSSWWCFLYAKASTDSREGGTVAAVLLEWGGLVLRPKGNRQ